MPGSGDVIHESHFMYSKAQEEQFDHGYSLVQMSTYNYYH
jgi:hypothetical protein